jgi:hypothetical protein
VIVDDLVNQVRATPNLTPCDDGAGMVEAHGCQWLLEDWRPRLPDAEQMETWY